MHERPRSLVAIQRETSFAVYKHELTTATSKVQGVGDDNPRVSAIDTINEALIYKAKHAGEVGAKTRDRRRDNKRAPSPTITRRPFLFSRGDKLISLEIIMPAPARPALSA